jgi:hypothetical protein
LRISPTARNAASTNTTPATIIPTKGPAMCAELRAAVSSALGNQQKTARWKLRSASAMLLETV